MFFEEFLFDKLRRIRILFKLSDFKQNERNHFVKRNIFLSFIFKLLAVVCTFLAIPLILKQISIVNYGVFLTASSYFSIITMLDFGIGNFVKNKLAESLADKDLTNARILISTSYFPLLLVGFFLIITYILCFPFLNWGRLLNVPAEFQFGINLTMFIMFFLFVFQLIIKHVNFIFSGSQNNYLLNVLNFCTNLLTLLLIVFAGKLIGNSLFVWCVLLTLVPIVSATILSTSFFRFSAPELRPQWRSIQMSKVQELLFSGVPFFIVQIGTALIFSTDNILINYFLGPDEVTVYAIAQRYFSIILVFFSLIISPFWPAVTNAYFKKDFVWMGNATKNLIYLWMGVVIITLIMLLVAPFAYHIWIGDDLKVPFILSAGTAGFVVISAWNSIFSHFINGIGSIKLSTYISFITFLLNIPLSIIFIKYFNYGLGGIIIANCICLFIGSVLIPIQYFKIINRTARGIWLK